MSVAIIYIITLVLFLAHSPPLPSPSSSSCPSPSSPSSNVILKGFIIKSSAGGSGAFIAISPPVVGGGELTYKRP